MADSHDEIIRRLEAGVQYGNRGARAQFARGPASQRDESTVLGRIAGSIASPEAEGLAPVVGVDDGLDEEQARADAEANALIAGYEGRKGLMPDGAPDLAAMYGVQGKPDSYNTGLSQPLRQGAPRPRKGKPVKPSQARPFEPPEKKQPAGKPAPLTKQQEAKAAIAQMKQAEGRQLSRDEAEALALFQNADSLYDMAGAKTVVSQANPLYHERKAHLGATKEAQEQILGGRVNEYNAALEHERNVEAFRSRVALEEEMVQAGIAAREQTRQRAMDEAIAATKESQQLVQAAAQQFQRTPAVDPNRYWADRTAGQKFGAVLLGIVRGAMGEDPLAHIRDAISRDIDAQKTNLDQSYRQFGVLNEAFQAQRGAYQDIRLAVEDERTADMIYERARLQQAENEFQWWMQKGKVSQMTAGQQAFLGQIKQAQADLDMQIAQGSAANPKMFTRVRHVFDKEERKAMRDRAARREDLAGKLVTGSAEQRGRMDIEGMKAQIDAQKSAREEKMQVERGPHGVYSEVQSYARTYGNVDGAIRQIDDILGNSDIPGFVNLPGAGQTPQYMLGVGDASRTETKIRLLKEALGRAQSGGAITADELVNFTNIIEGGTKWGGEDRLRLNLDELRGMLDAKRESGRRGLSPEALEYLDRNVNEPGFDAEFTGSAYADDGVAVHE
jgi:hypothetical protein